MNTVPWLLGMQGALSWTAALQPLAASTLHLKKAAAFFTFTLFETCCFESYKAANISRCKIDCIYVP